MSVEELNEVECPKCGMSKWVTRCIPHGTSKADKHHIECDNCGFSTGTGVTLREAIKILIDYIKWRKTKQHAQPIE